MNLIEKYIQNLFRQTPHATLLYHNLGHTEEVVEIATRISREMRVDAELLKLIQIAGWFHDIGYLTSHENHEERSALLAKDYLKTYLTTSEIEIVEQCILATKMDALPSTEAEAILKDADIAYGAIFHFHDSQIRKEWELNQERFYNEKEWHDLQFAFLSGIQFYSKYGKEYFAPQVAKELQNYH